MDGYQIILPSITGFLILSVAHQPMKKLFLFHHITMTSDIDWGINDIIAFFYAIIDTVYRSNFDDNGNSRHHTVSTHTLHAKPDFFPIA
jgi:hypothetical protein